MHRRVRAIARSPPKYRDGPRAAKVSTPGRVISSRGTMVATASATRPKARASTSGSWATSRTCGQRACASRRRCPMRTPAAAATNDRATTRLACTTATASSGAQPAATTGHCGQCTTVRRGRPARAPAMTGASHALTPSGATVSARCRPVMPDVCRPAIRCRRWGRAWPVGRAGHVARADRRR